MKKFGLLGCGAMGFTIAKAIKDGFIEGRLTTIFDVSLDACKTIVGTDGKIQIAENIDELITNCDFVIEAASQEAVKQHTLKIVSSGCDILIMSVGALLDEDFFNRIVEISEKNSSKIYIPSGALTGIDGLKAASTIEIEEISLTTIKPPKSLEGVEYLIKQGIEVDKLEEPTVLFEGCAPEAARHFPKNINVAAVITLSIGKACKVKIIADPNTEKNTHKIVLSGEFGKITTITENTPSPKNPKTSYMACLSAISVLKNISKSVKIGN